SAVAGILVRVRGFARKKHVSWLRPSAGGPCPRTHQRLIWRDLTPEMGFIYPCRVNSSPRGVGLLQQRDDLLRSCATRAFDDIDRRFALVVHEVHFRAMLQQ